MNWYGERRPPPGYWFGAPEINDLDDMIDHVDRARRRWEDWRREIREDLEKGKKEEKKEKKSVIPVYIALGLATPIVFVIWNLVMVGGVIQIIKMVKTIQ